MLSAGSNKVIACRVLFNVFELSIIIVPKLAVFKLICKIDKFTISSNSKIVLELYFCAEELICKIALENGVITLFSSCFKYEFFTFIIPSFELSYSKKAGIS